MKALSKDDWANTHNIQDRYQRFCEEYGDSVGDYEIYVELHYQDYLQDFKRLHPEEPEEDSEPCPACGKPLRAKWSGVECSASCGYWDCF